MSASREKRKRREERAAEVAGGTGKKKKGLSGKQLSVLKTACSLVVIVAILLVIVSNSGVVQQQASALTVGSEKITACTFNYYYTDAYNNFVSTYSSYISYFLDTSKPLDEQQYSDTQTWADYFADAAQNNAGQVTILCAAAKEAGYTLSEDAQESVNNQIASLDTYASYQGYSDGKAYLIATYGKGSSVKSYTEYLKNNYLASEYAQYLGDSYTYTDDQLKAYYSENKDTLDTVDYRSFLITADTVATDSSDADTEDEDDTAALEAAKTVADDMAAQSQGSEETFIKLAYENAAEDSKETYSDDAATLSKNQNKESCGSDYADWLFDSSRVAGETTVVDNGTSGYYVVMFLSRSANDYKTANVRHILIQPVSTSEDASDDSSDSSTTEFTEEEWATAETEANSIYEEWKAGDATEDSFATLANAKSTDTGSSSNGGLYEGVYKGQMLEEFEDWCFDPSRQAGDTGIVKTSYGYHIMYFSGYGDEYWKTLADSGLREQDYSDWYTSFSANYEVKMKSFGMLFTSK